MRRQLGFMLGMMLLGGTHAVWAQGAAAPAPQGTASAAQATAAADVRAGTGYQSHAVVGEATSFPSGTLVFAVSTVTGADGTTVRHVWKKDGAEIWSANLQIGSVRWTTNSRRLLKAPGQYSVHVLSADGGEIGKVEFTIQ